MKLLDPDLKYEGNNSPMILCSKNTEGKYEKIATIEYSGLFLTFIGF